MLCFKNKTSKVTIPSEVLVMPVQAYNFYIPEAGGAGSSGLPAFFNGIWIRT